MVMRVPWRADSGTDAQDYVSGMTPVTVIDVTWREWAMTHSLYLTDRPPPTDLVTSTRCVVTDGERVLVCETPNGCHVVPGGRREVGETWEETARREVQEETGYTVAEMEQVAVLLIHMNNERHPDPEQMYPYPDAFWVIYRAEPLTWPADGWADTQGWELSSAMHPVGEVLRRDDLEPVHRALIQAIFSAESP